MQLPTEIPTSGFYYHYKHDPCKAINNYAYEVVGIGLHTEDDVWYVNYLPLYTTAEVYKVSQALGVVCMDNRPLEMWMDKHVMKDGVDIGLRFIPINDPDVIEALVRIKEKLYPGRR